jgi:hypothetical protein
MSHPHGSRATLALALFVAAVHGSARAQEWSWHVVPTAGSAASLTDLHGKLVGSSVLAPGVPVENVRFGAEGFEFVLESGTLWLETAIDGVSAGAYFEGKGTVRFNPSGRRALSNMTFWFGREQLEPTPLTNAYFFTLRGKDLATEMGITATPSIPILDTSGYAECKQAFRQLGMTPLRAFLNREGRSRGAVYAVFPLEATRTTGSAHSMMLCSFDPSRKDATQISVGGHAAVMDQPAWKFFFWPIVQSRAGTRAFEPQGRVSSYTSKIDMPKTLAKASVKTTIRFRANAGARALELELNPRIQVRGVTGPGGAALPFAQWTYATDGVNADPSVLVDLGAPTVSGQEIEIEVDAFGPLFDAFDGNWLLADEDAWYPQLDDPEQSDHELTIAVPKSLTPVAPGAKLSDEVAGGVRTVHFKSVKPQKRTTLYVGAFELTKGEAAGTKVELYSDRSRSQTHVMGYDPETDAVWEGTALGASKNDIDYSRQEVENALKIYKGILGPIDLETLRVAGTPTGHGRGFEGLLLLSKFGGFGSDDSRADLFRAHEVAHLWWGNAVDTRNWPEDRWLSESFAEYAAMEFYTLRFKNPGKTHAFMEQQWVRPVLGASREPVSTLDGQKRRVRSSELRPLIDGTQNVYTKGPLVIHMLRNLFILFKGSDEKFWLLLQDFIADHKNGLVTTEDFIKAAEEKLGGRIPWFWDQWIYGSELPHISWTSRIEQQNGQWQVAVDARKVDSTYQLALPVYVTLQDGRRARQFLDLSGPAGHAVVKVPSKPKAVSVNDNFEVLAFIDKE